MTTVIEAARSLLSVCDGAVRKDDQGYNGLDSRFVRDVLGRMEETGRPLTYKQEQAILRTLKKYTEQLSRFGIKYDEIKIGAKPKETISLSYGWNTSDVPSRVKLAKLAGLEGKIGSASWESISPKDQEIIIKAIPNLPEIMTHVQNRERMGPMKLDVKKVKNKFINFFLYSNIDFKEKAKAIPTAHWDPMEKAWTYFNRWDIIQALKPYMKEEIIKPTKEAEEEIFRLGNLQIEAARTQNQVNRTEEIKTGIFTKEHLSDYADFERNECSPNSTRKWSSICL